VTTTTSQDRWPQFFAALTAGAGDRLGPTEWVSLSQLEVDLYGGLIADLDPMHNDPGWQAGIDRWGGTIIIGSHLLSMLPGFLRERGFPVGRDDVRYEPLGLPRVRFVSPLPIGHRARDTMRVLDVTAGERTWTVRTEHTVEREGLERPFLFAQLVSRFSEL
jgi:acyl dehydratase